jgi:L-cysteate sulfo-lyase
MKDLGTFPRCSLGYLPTPLDPLERLSEWLGGPDIWIKRDDCTGLATGGNKTRKLEFLMGEALNQGCDSVITFGAMQSNHVRQTAAAAAKLGLGCEAILVPLVPYHEEAYRTSANLLLDDLLGANIHVVSDESATNARLEQLTVQLAAEGRKPYVIPTGGSNSTGALGYVGCALEITEQACQLGIEPDYLVHASATGGTQSGLVTGLHYQDSTTRVIGVNVYDNKPQRLPRVVRTLCDDLCHRLDCEPVAENQIEVVNGYVGEGYGLPTDAMIEAVRALASREGILLDPVYTGKAFSGLIDMIRRGVLYRGQTVVFVHTGGSAGLFAYPTTFRQAEEH